MSRRESTGATRAVVPSGRPRTRNLKAGQAVFAIGNPYGSDHSLTTGVISALNRTIESVDRTEIQGVIQVDAAINPGNSGGPLLDSAGRLIGMKHVDLQPERRERRDQLPPGCNRDRPDRRWRERIIEESKLPP